MYFDTTKIENKFEILEKILFFFDNSFLLFIISLFIFFAVKNKFLKYFSFGSAIFFIFLIYSSQVERFWIKTEYINLEKGWGNRIVLIADQHLGIYKNSDYMERIVEKINNIPDVDFVVIAGDFTYYPKDLKKEHGSLSKIKKKSLCRSWKSRPYSYWKKKYEKRTFRCLVRI